MSGPANGGYDVAALLAEKQRRTAARPFTSLEELFVSPDLFNLPTATPMQRAVCRIAEGAPLGDLADDVALQEAIGVTGDDLRALTGHKPRELVILSGIRVGKSLIAALLTIYWSQIADVSKLGPGEMPRISIVSTSKDNANVVFGHIVGRIEASPKLKALLIGAPSADSLVLRHPTGRPIEVCVVAGTRAGGSLVSRWSAGCIFDEFPRMVGADEGVVNWDDSRRGVRERMLPGTQIVSIGSPWAPYGPAYDTFTTTFGKPSNQIVLLKTPAWNFNPFYWNAEKIEEARENPDTFQTDCLGEFANPEESLFATIEVDISTRSDAVWLPYDSRLSYRAAMDPATRGNGWTLVVTTLQGGKKKVVACKEWRGSKMVPLKPRDTFMGNGEDGGVIGVLRTYNIKTVDTDQHLIDAIREYATEAGVFIRQVNLTQAEASRRYIAIKSRLASGEIELLPDKTFRSDLLHLKKRTTNNGVKVVLPKTGDGRHCDYAPSFMLAISSYLEESAPGENLSADEKIQRMADRMKQQRFAEVRRLNEKTPWRKRR